VASGRDRATGGRISAYAGSAGWCRRGDHCQSASNIGSSVFLVQRHRRLRAAQSLARRRSRFARPYICRFRSLSLVTWPSVWPLDHGSLIAASTAGRSAAIPRANAPITLFVTSLSQASRSALVFDRRIAVRRLHQGDRGPRRPAQLDERRRQHFVDPLLRNSLHE
jgi:hypothetical protein